MTQIRKIGLRIKTVIKCLIILVGLLIPSKASANENQFINIVNPVRVSKYTQNSDKALSSQYEIIKNLNLPATWLVTYDVLKNERMVSILKNMHKTQEIGLFLEITPDFAAAAGVTYHDTGSWHHANSVFLSGYTQDERLMLIDKLFNQFERIFGFYPSAVGSWWTDSFSLAYMAEKYGVTINLTCSDQFSTDGYQIWGQPWQFPYYPSKYHSGLPASSLSTKLDVVMIQWASRDPLNGYKNSLYSTQDYSVVGGNLNTSYFEKIVHFYGSQNRNLFGQVTVGLESDLNPEGYKGEFANQIKVVSSIATNDNFKLVSMSNFAKWYRGTFKDLSPSSKFETEDFLGTKNTVVWYQSSRYRIGVVYDYENSETKIFDLRVYGENTHEPYYTSPNREPNLSIYVKSIIDEVINPADVVIINGVAEIDFKEDYFTIKKTFKDIPKVFQGRPDLFAKQSDGELSVKIQNSNFNGDGIIIKDFSAEAKHFFKQKKSIFYLLSGKGWEYFKKVQYLIPQGEIEALEKLASLPQGRVVVFDNECLQCEYHTQVKPAALDNRRGYVKKLGKHSIIYDSSFFTAENQKKARENFNDLRAKYIYLVKFEGYIEKLPFSPGDFNVEKVFSNANAEIWKVK